MIRRGDYYYHALMYRPCMELWKYTFRVRLATLHPLSRELEYTSYKVLLQLQIQCNVIIKLKHWVLEVHFLYTSQHSLFLKKY